MNYLTDYASLYGFVSALAVLLSTLLLTGVSKPSNLVEVVLLYFILCSGQIILTGYLLSAIYSLDRVDIWAIVAVFLLLVISSYILLTKKLRQAVNYVLRKPDLGQLKIWLRRLSFWEKMTLLLLAVVTILTGSINLIMVLFSAPYTWDSMTYHLARAVYYMQQGSLDYFGANYWAQVVHPKHATVLIIYTFLVTGLNENLTRIIQFIAYWTSTVAVYGISRRNGFARAASLFSALVFALLIENLMQATTTQNDMLLTAYIGTAVYFLFAFKDLQQKKYLFLAAISLGLAAGVKASMFLAIPALLVVLWYTLSHQNRWITLANARWFLISTIVALIVFVLPAGYWDNYQMFDHPIGPASIRNLHSFEGSPPAEIIDIGTKNVMRFGFDFLSLDGLPQIGPIVAVQTYLRALPIWIVKILNIDLETSEGVIAPFEYHRVPRSHEDGAFWGVFGFGLVWIMAVLAAVGVTGKPSHRVLAVAAILFWLTQAYVGPYDPWRGRYFITAGIFATPLVGWLFNPNRNNLIKVYVTGIVLLGALSAFTAVAVRPRSMLFTIQYGSEIRRSVFSMDRLTQLTRNRPYTLDFLREYEAIVPKNATVALYLEADTYEYPYFGQELTRTLIPINPFQGETQSVPEEADYLLFSSKLLESEERDICSAADIYCLRDLKKAY